MGIRGRKSTASLLVIAAGPGLLPEAPDTLTAKQAELWRAVVATKPSGWWGADSLPLLVAYVKAVEAHGVVSAQLDAFDVAWLADDDGVKRFDRLTLVFDRMSKLIALLATKMRLSQQSRYDTQKASVADRHAGAGTKPWQRAKVVAESPAATKTSPG